MEAKQHDEYSYHCSPEWHLAQLRHTPLAGLLYSFALRISKKSGRFHGSVLGIAEYFGVGRWKVQRALAALVDLGFFVRDLQERFTPTVYRVIAHKDWAAQHPGGCAVKAEFPWSTEEGDQLGKRLWNASGGKLKYKMFQLKTLRKTGLTDDQIVRAFEGFVGAEQTRRETQGLLGGWDKVQVHFRRWIAGEMQATELMRLGLNPFCAPAEPKKVA